MHRLFTRIIGPVGGIVLLASCATTSLVDSWRNPNLAGSKLHKLLVAGIANDGGGIKVYEDILANELQQRGVEAVPAHSVISKEKRDQQTLELTARQTGSEAIITVKPVKLEQQKFIQPGYATTYPSYFYPSPAWDYGHYGAATYYEPPYVRTYDVETIEVILLDVETGRFLWAAYLRSSEPDNEITVGKDLARIILQSLAKERFI